MRTLRAPLRPGLLGFVAAAMLASCHEPRALPDVVLVTVDTLRADHLGAYGYAGARTPRLDALAAEGRVFTQAITPFPRTTPAIASLLSALSPVRHGSREIGKPLRRDVLLLPEILSVHGWMSVGVSSNLAAGSRQGLERGFDRFVDRDALPDHRAASVTDKALALVHELPDSRPVFLWAHYSDPHFPYDPPDALAGVPAAEECRRLQGALASRPGARGAIVANSDGAAERARDGCVQLYDAEVSYTDEQIARLLDGLRSAGRLEKFFLVFTSDHGENLGEAGLYYEHGPSVHDASLRVPLIFVGEGVVPGVDDRVARLEDVVPTVLDCLGLPHDDLGAVDGQSLAARLRGEPGPRDPEVAFAEAGRAFHRQDLQRLISGPAGKQCLHGERYSLCQTASGGFGLHDPRTDPGLAHDLSRQQPEARRELLRAWRSWRGRDARERTARTPRFKLVERPVLQGWERRLYDLENDPGELRDASAEHPQVVEQLASRLAHWTSTLPEQPPELEPREVELLRQLGYVE